MTTPPRTVTEARDALAMALHETGLNTIGKAAGSHGRFTGRCICNADADRILAALPDGWTLARTDLAARVEALEGALRFLSTYEKDPPEVLKDDYAYDRLLAFIHEVAALALLSEPTPAPVEPYDETDDMCPNCQTPWKCNGPHFAEFTPRAKRAAAPAPVERCAFYEPYNTDPCGRPKESAVHDAVYGSRAHHPFTPEARDE